MSILLWHLQRPIATDVGGPTSGHPTSTTNVDWFRTRSRTEVWGRRDESRVEMVGDVGGEDPDVLEELLLVFLEVELENAWF